MSGSMKTVVVTGASRGLGRAMAEKFIALGHTVLACARSRPMMEQLAARHGNPHDFATVDVAIDTEVGAWANRLLQSRPAPDLLINNAAVVNANAPLWEVPEPEFSRVIDVNIKGTANVIRHFVPAMIRRGRGVIVNFSSGWGRSTDADVAPYCATKWAIEGLTRALAQELPKGMAAIPINPGVVNTDMLQSCFGSAASSYPSPADWAESAVPYLLRLGPRDNGKPLTV
jgi:NAD(P)-dependent dehydrogenase (short-subunit alcohol dehydrogenase family)